MVRQVHSLSRWVAGDRGGATQLYVIPPQELEDLKVFAGTDAVPYLPVCTGRPVVGEESWPAADALPAGVQAATPSQRLNHASILTSIFSSLSQKKRYFTTSKLGEPKAIVWAVKPGIPRSSPSSKPAPLNPGERSYSVTGR